MTWIDGHCDFASFIMNASWSDYAPLSCRGHDWDITLSWVTLIWYWSQQFVKAWSRSCHQTEFLSQWGTPYIYMFWLYGLHGSWKQGCWKLREQPIQFFCLLLPLTNSPTTGGVRSRICLSVESRECLYKSRISTIARVIGHSWRFVRYRWCVISWLSTSVQPCHFAQHLYLSNLEYSYMLLHESDAWPALVTKKARCCIIPYNTSRIGPCMYS